MLDDLPHDPVGRTALRVVADNHPCRAMLADVVNMFQMDFPQPKQARPLPERSVPLRSRKEYGDTGAQVSQFIVKELRGWAKLSGVTPIRRVAAACR